MQRTYSGAWASKAIGGEEVPYVGALKWGTGINQVHAMYGEGPPIRVMGREGEEGSAGYDGQPAGLSVPQQWIPTELWGYKTEDDLSNNYVWYDDRPTWGEQPPDYRGDTEGHPAAMNNDPAQIDTTGTYSVFRMLAGGAHRFRQKLADALPSETVTEGWRNKPKGMPANSIPSDNSQLIIQTSMRQRYQTRNNDHAVARATDDPREVIHSRVIGQKLKIYSGEQRHYDMFPYQQDIIVRPFWYRRAGTGIPEMMAPNEMYQSSPYQRTPPPDPDLGPEEISSSADYGYTGEDQMYYA
jgi:hypothetical protein